MSLLHSVMYASTSQLFSSFGSHFFSIRALLLGTFLDDKPSNICATNFVINEGFPVCK